MLAQGRRFQALQSAFEDSAVSWKRESDTQKDPAWYASWRKSSNSLILTNIARIASEQHRNWNIWDLRKKMIFT